MTNYLKVSSAVNYLHAPSLLSADSPISLTITEGGDPLLKLSVSESGTLTAQYEPEDLDEAARIFVESALRYYNASIVVNLRRSQEEPPPR